MNQNQTESKPSPSEQPASEGLDETPCSVPWDGYALEEVDKHAHALRAKCLEITSRCALPSVTDYTVKMAIREMTLKAAPPHPTTDCREARFRELLEATIMSHATPDNGNYNYCDEHPCEWCREAKALAPRRERGPQHQNTMCRPTESEIDRHSAVAPAAPCSVGEAMATIRKALQSLNIHIKKHGLPAAVKLDDKWIALCEKPFPLSEGNLADEEIQFFRIAHEMSGRRVGIYRDEMNRTVVIRISSQNDEVARESGEKRS